MLRPLRLVLALLLAAVVLPSLAGAAGPRQVRILLDERVTLQRVQEAGLDIAAARPGVSVDVFEWPGDELLIAALNASVTLVDDDPGLHAAMRARAELASRPKPASRQVLSAAREDGKYRIESYPPEGSGSFGGFWTLAEVKMKLDDLVASDTQGLVADKLDTLGYSLQGRPVWGLKLGSVVDAPDNRPVVLYSALTHAREPGGMQALLHFVDQLIASYPSDPVAKYLLEHRQIYICPVVNPDGYSFNKRIWDSTGAFGLWRKNLHDNNANGHTDAGEGVDINRNYGYKWGLNNVGSSGTSSSDIYRGTAAFSEPETRIQRDLVDAIHPVSGFAFHTYSDLYVHPWGWTTTGTPDSAKFQTWTDEFSFTNGFVGGPGPRILYEVNGEFSDWTYGDTLLKPRAFTWTPEVGGAADGFWPPPSRLQAINESVLRSCYQVAGIAGPWVRVEKTTMPDGYLSAGAVGRLIVRAKNSGATGTAGPNLRASLTALDAGMDAMAGTVAYPNLNSFDSADPNGNAYFLISAADSVTPGRLVRFRVDFTDDQGLYCRDTVEVVVGVPTVLALDNGQSLANWTRRAGNWGIVSTDANHPDAYIADSPTGVYPNNYAGQLRLNGSFDLSSGVHAWAFFEDRYAFEQEYDAGLFEASVDTTTWTALPNNSAITGADFNVAGPGQKIFVGTRWRWRQDRVDLSRFAGDPLHTQTWLRFRSLSDAGANFDGMNFDSLRICVYNPAAQPVPTAVAPGTTATRLKLAPPSPNPARGSVAFAFETPQSGAHALDVLDVQGRVVYTHTADIARGTGNGPYAGRFAWSWDLKDRTGQRVAPGLYLVRLHSGSASSVSRMVVLP